MKKRMILASLIALSLSATATASEGHDAHQHSGHDNMNHGEMEMDKSSAMFLEKREVDGYTVSFHIMTAKDVMKHGGSHNLMVKIEQGGSALTDVVINSKVFHPNDSSETKMLMKMGDWYMAGYDLGHDGKHGIMVLFKTADGKKHKASVYYKEEK